MKLTVEEKDGIIHVKYPNKINTLLIEDFEKYFEKHKKKGTKDALVLSDVSDLVFFPFSIRTEYINKIKLLNYMIKKSAIFGVRNFAIKTAIKVCIFLANRSNIQIFNCKEEAIRWLKK